MRTDGEPRPRCGGTRRRSTPPDWRQVASWPASSRGPDGRFVDVLASRRSSVGGPVDDASLASLLRHATRPRFVREDGRFGSWESRPSPSAGGLAAIRLLVLPIDPEKPGGLYDERGGSLLLGKGLEKARTLNAESVGLLASACAGTTIQLVADGESYNSCYENPETLLWRDAGALCATLALVATALSLRSVVLGRVGSDVVEAARLGAGWRAAGAVHVTV